MLSLWLFKTLYILGTDTHVQTNTIWIFMGSIQPCCN